MPQALDAFHRQAVATWPDIAAVIAHKVDTEKVTSRHDTEPRHSLCPKNEYTFLCTFPELIISSFRIVPNELTGYHCVQHRPYLASREHTIIINI